MSWVEMFQRHPSPPPPPLPLSSAVCDECGGYFLPSTMQSVARVAIIDYQERPHWIAPIVARRIVWYCRECAPNASLEVTLQAGHGQKESDRRMFRIEDARFEDIDSETGEVLFTISNDEFDCTHCDKCGELIEEAFCRAHRTPAAQPTKKPAKPKRGRRHAL